MAQTQNFDQLNNLETFFEPMELPEEEKKRRIDMAWELFDIFYAMFVRVYAMQKLNKDDATIINDVCEAFGVRYKDVVVKYLDYSLDGQESLHTTLQGYLQGVIEPYIDGIVREMADTTIKHPDEPYFGSVERAVICAETETNTIGNSIAEEIAIASGKTIKTWVTMMDEKVRDTHNDIHGQTVPINDYFMVGGFPARYPHDPDLPADEIVNCRCVCEYS